LWHPMYLGGLMMWLGAPLLLGLTPIIVFRIIGEERMLVNKQDGYADYEKKVKYRLMTKENKLKIPIKNESAAGKMSRLVNDSPNLTK